MVSNDAALRIKAAQLGVEAARAPAGRAPMRPTRPAGWCDDRDRARARSTACTPPARSTSPTASRRRATTLTENEFAVLRAGSQSALDAPGRRRAASCCRTPRPRRGGCAPARKEQRFALELLLDPDDRASSPSTAGPAPARRSSPSPPGSSRSSSSRRYERLAVYRPLVPVGQGRRRVPARRPRREARPVDVRDPRRDRRPHRPAAATPTPAT